MNKTTDISAHKRDHGQTLNGQNQQTIGDRTMTHRNFRTILTGGFVASFLFLGILTPGTASAAVDPACIQKCMQLDLAEQPECKKKCKTADTGEPVKTEKPVKTTRFCAKTGQTVEKTAWTKEACAKEAAPKDNDRDDDGITNDEDACPDEPGIETDDPDTNGCPDRDGDKIVDKEDACPEKPGIATDDPATNGCPAKSVCQYQGEDATALTPCDQMLLMLTMRDLFLGTPEVTDKDGNVITPAVPSLATRLSNLEGNGRWNFWYFVALCLLILGCRIKPRKTNCAELDKARENADRLQNALSDSQKLVADLKKAQEEANKPKVRTPLAGSGANGNLLARPSLLPQEQPAPQPQDTDVLTQLGIPGNQPGNG